MRKLRFQKYNKDASTFVGELGSVFFDSDSTVLRIGDGETAGGNVVSGGGGGLPQIEITYSDAASSANDSTGSIGDSGIISFEGGAADVLFTVTSETTVTATGVIAFYDSSVVTATGAATDGANGVRFLTGIDQADFVVMVFATNASGTVYSAPSSGTSRLLCLAEGTRITLSDGTHKLIEDITYDDSLLVWDFDRGCFAASKPLWIRQAATADAYNVLRFSNDATLRTIGQHRIFNKEAGEFTYPLTDATPLGTTSYSEHGDEVSLVAKHVVTEVIDYYNVITDYHMNLFANGILTSTSFNNIYPIKDMKFVKDNRAVRTYQNIANRFYDGMRLAEQTRDTAEIERYIARLVTSAYDTSPVTYLALVAAADHHAWNSPSYQSE